MLDERSPKSEDRRMMTDDWWLMTADCRLPTVDCRLTLRQAQGSKLKTAYVFLLRNNKKKNTKSLVDRFLIMDCNYKKSCEKQG